MKRKNINRSLGGLRMDDQGEWSPQTFLVNNRPLQKRERTGKEYGCFPFA